MGKKLLGKKLASATWCVQTATKKELMKESNVLIDDNFLNNKEIADIEERVTVHGLDIPWTLAYNTDVPIDGVLSENSYQFAAGLHKGMPAYDYFLQVFKKFCITHNISYNEITRMKLNWLPRVTADRGNKAHTPHIDSEIDHRVFLYYLNESDGDTVFFKEAFNGETPTQFSESLRVSPSAGKGVIFDGHTYHASSSPSNSEFRCILNIDFN